MIGSLHFSEPFKLMHFLCSPALVQQEYHVQTNKF